MKTPYLRTSERTTEKRCQWRWLQSYRFGLKPKRVAPALLFGTWVHAALADWYCGPGQRRGPEPAETFARLAEEDLIGVIKVKDATEESVARYGDLRSLGITLLEEYRAAYGRDEHWHVIAPEQTFRMDIPWPDLELPFPRGRKRLAILIGTLDLVFRDLRDDLIWVGEHKTAKTIGVDHLPLDEQGGTYCTVAARSLARQGLLKQGERVHGVMYNFLRKGLPDVRPKDAEGYSLNKDGTRSKVQPAALFRRVPLERTRAARKAQLVRIQSSALRMEFLRRGTLPIEKTTHWSCARFCEFFDMCRLHEEGGNWQDLRDVAYVVQDPYADHRKSTDETSSFEF